jgi:hypothetical protein
VSGVKGFPPPETTKVAITALSGYQAEACVLAVGLDIDEKFKALQLQMEQGLGKEGLAKFSLLDFTVYGRAKEDPESEAEGTAYLRVLAQAPKLDAFEDNFFMMTVMKEGLGHFPGMSWNMESALCCCSAAKTDHLRSMRLATPKQYMGESSTTS